MKNKIIIFLVLIFLTLSGNCVYAKKQPHSIRPEREIEYAVFETSDISKVVQSAINTLQDSGFIIQEYEPELGYIRAEKYYKKKHLNKKRVAKESLKLAAFSTYAVFSYGTTAYYVADPTRRLSNEFHDKTVVVDANVSIEPIENQTKVRFVFTQKVLQNADGYSFMKSTPTKIIRTYNPKIYQEFFTQIYKHIFYEET